MAGDQTPRDERRDGPAPGDERRDAGLPFGRRRRTAASALVAMLVALALGALLNAPAMKKTALAQPFGAERSFRLALVDPLAAVSHWLFLDRPAKFTAVALGKPDPGPTGTSVVVVRPTPGPTAGGKPGDKRRQATQVAPGAPAAQAVQGAPDAPVHRRRLDAGPARHGADQPVQQDQADQAAAGLPDLHRPGAAGRLQLAGAAPAAGQGVPPGRRGRDVRRQRQPAAPDRHRRDPPVRLGRLEAGVPQARPGRRSACCSRTACGACTGSGSRSCRRRRSTARSG